MNDIGYNGVSNQCKEGMLSVEIKSINSEKRYKWVYLLFVIISFLPLYTEVPYRPEETQAVLVSLFKISLTPYKGFGFVFHLATLLLVGLIILYKEKMGRITAAYIGVNYLIIAFVQTIGTTQEYGLVIQTGALAGSLILGVVWLGAAAKQRVATSFEGAPLRRYALLPLALLAFWAPYNGQIEPSFDPLLLITSPDYGLTFCFTTPVFLFLLILFYPKVDLFAYRVTAFNGLLYGLFNMSHFFHPDLVWMGVLHLPLLILSVIALLLPRFRQQ